MYKRCHHCNEIVKHCYVSETDIAIVWCGRCVEEHFHVLKAFELKDEPVRDGMHFVWRRDYNLDVLNRVPKYDNIIS